MTPADYCEAMARWWRDASAGDAPVASEATKDEVYQAYREATAGPFAAGPARAPEEVHAAAWDRAAARLRGSK